MQDKSMFRIGKYSFHFLCQLTEPSIEELKLYEIFLQKLYRFTYYNVFEKV